MTTVGAPQTYVVKACLSANGLRCTLGLYQTSGAPLQTGLEILEGVTEPCSHANFIIICSRKMEGSSVRNWASTTLQQSLRDGRGTALGSQRTATLQFCFGYLWDGLLWISLCTPVSSLHRKDPTMPTSWAVRNRYTMGIWHLPF